jgi:hypothetical protein
MTDQVEHASDSDSEAVFDQGTSDDEDDEDDEADQSSTNRTNLVRKKEVCSEN